MDKLRIAGIILLMISVMTNVQAQTYDRLWKQVEEWEKKDLPQSVVAEAGKIYEKAKAEKNAPQMMKAYLTMMTYRGEMAPDSMEADKNFLKEWAEDENTSVPDRAVLRSVLGGLSIEKDWEEGNDWLLASLEDSLALFDYPAGKLVPIVKVGETSRLYFDDNLYDLLARRAICLWQQNQWGEHREEALRNVKRTYDTLLNYYEREKKRSAWLLTALDADSEADEAQLRAWIKEYGDLDVCAETYLRLAQRIKEPAERLAVLREAIHRYPRYNRINALKNEEREILSPRVTLNIASAYPGKSIKVSVGYRNLEELTVEAYRLRLSADSEELRKVNEKTVKEYGTFFRREALSLLPTPDYRMTDTVVALKPLPQGVYYLIATSRKHKEARNGTWLVVDAEMKISRPLPDGKLETVTLDKETGTPHEVIVEKNTNGWNPYRYSVDDKKRIRTKLFTDRSLYRPGQTVCFSGWLYEQQQDSAGVVKGENVQVTLTDADNKEVAQVEATTDDFGTFHGSFKLPDACQTGTWHMKAADTWQTIRVEEYKRPTFEVTFEPVKDTYQPGDSIRVTGRAVTFAGAPVQNARVNYQIVQTGYGWWRANGSAIRQVRGEALTDASGRFVVPVYFIPMTEDDKPWRCVYQVSAEVTDVSGETQTGKLDLPLGSSSVQMSLEDWNEIGVKEQPKPITIRVSNLLGHPVMTEVACSVLKDDRPVTSFTAASNQAFVPESLYRLPSGKYILKISVKDERGKVCEDSYPFVLFSLADNRVPRGMAQWGCQTSETFPSTVYYGSSEENVTVFYDVFCGEKHIESRRIVLSDSLLCFPFEYKEEYGDGIRVSLAFVKDSQLYAQYFTIQKPQPDKKLGVKWTTFRDKLQPGSKETWTLQVTAPDGKPVDAQLLATMYDASLDAFAPHDWAFRLLFNRNIPRSVWRAEGGGMRWLNLYFPVRPLKVNPLAYSELELPFRVYMYKKFGRGVMAVAGANAEVEEAMIFRVDTEHDAAPDSRNTDVPIRTNFSETAFFYPNLRTDANGEVSISFTLPESLTTWKFMGLAHTKDMDYGQITSVVVASKEFMIQPNLPRFVRVGDEVSLSASLINLSDKEVIGNVRMELFNPATDKVYLVKKQRFLVTPEATASVSFGFVVSEEYTDLAVRWVAEGDTFSDGEQRMLPVLSNKRQMTESVPIYINGKGTSTFPLESLFNHHSRSVSRPTMRVEFTGNPGWYAVQALQTLRNPDNEDVISWAAAYYANTLTAYLAETNPEIAHRFQTDTLAVRTSEAVRRLRNLQDEEGAWSWYRGMPGNRYMTTQVVEWLARLQQQTGRPFADGEAKDMYERALAYLAKEAKEEYLAMKQEKQGLKSLCPSEQVLHYLYICALDGAPKADKVVNGYFIDKLAKLENLGLLTIYGKAVGAIILEQADKTEKAKELLQSLLQYSVYTDEMGRYFDTPRAEYSWCSYRIPTQVAAIEAVHRIANEEKTVEEMKRWLLQQKRVQDWNTPIATTDAVYALLNVGENVLTNTGECQIVLGKDKIRVTKNDTLAYINREVKGNVMNIREVTVKKASQGIGWGAVYAEYWEDMDRISAQGNALSVRKAIYKDGRPLADDVRLQVGDKLTVRLTVKADRDMDFVEVKDERAACMEPVDMLSGYRWKDGIGYYQRTKDSSTSFFIGQMRKGTYTLQYEVHVTLAGSYQEGAATVRSVYAPEFGGHIGGGKVQVE